MESKVGQRFVSALIVIVLSVCVVSATTAQSCSNHSFANNEVFAACVDHPVLNSFLHWTYNPSNSTLRIAFRRPSTTLNQWVAWAINPHSLAMFGSQALIAYPNSSSGAPHVYTSSIIPPFPTMQQSPLSFEVPQLTATHVNDEITIFATILLPPGLTTVNQVWQVGPMSQGSPISHDMADENRRSLATLDLLTGSSTTTSSTAVDSALRRRYIHGVLNAVSWGTLMPMGALLARYLKFFNAANPAWFYLHVGCQTTAYAVGVAGWATGIKLGRQSTAVHYITHRNIGIALFAMATLQIFAMFLRPNKDHKYRVYWNIYHHSMGYSVIIMSIFNVFEGLKILCPGSKWRQAYTGVVIFLGAVAVVLETVTWFIVIKRRRSNSDKLPPNINAHNARVENIV